MAARDPRPTIRDLRQSRSLSQREVGRRLARPNSIVSLWESGHRQPTLADLDALARVFGVEPDELLASGWQGAPRRWSSRAYDWRQRTAVGRALESVRLARRVSRTEVLAETGIRGLRLAAIEAGVDPGIDEARALLALYGCTLSQLLTLARLDSLRLSHRVPPPRLLLTVDPLSAANDTDAAS